MVELVEIDRENRGSDVFALAEIVQACRTTDWLILTLSFLMFTGGFHLHAMLTMGDWDFWTDWKDRRQWVAVTPIMCITFPAALQYFMWGKLRLPFGATFPILGLLFGEWVNRYFNFWGWTYFPINFVWAATLVPGAIILDVILLWAKSFLVTAVVGSLAFGLIFYPGNWAMLAPLHQPVEYHGLAMTIADIQGFHYVRTSTPEYLRFIEKGSLRTFGKDVVPVSAFFSGFICVLIYFIWHFFGRWFCTTRYLEEFAPTRNLSFTPQVLSQREGELLRGEDIMDVLTSAPPEAVEGFEDFNDPPLWGQDPKGLEKKFSITIEISEAVEVFNNPGDSDNPPEWLKAYRVRVSGSSAGVGAFRKEYLSHPPPCLSQMG